LGALASGFTAFKVANLFLDMVCKLHGFPKSIVSYRDPIFVSRFWKELFRLSGTRLRLSTSYHPQSDGQTEVMNRVVEQYLRCFIHVQPSTWHQYLALAEWSYNTSLHSSSGLTPFEIVYGKPPPTVLDYVPSATSNEAAQSLLETRHTLHLKLKRKLQKARERMKKYADSKRDDVTFVVGQWVYVKLRPGRQTSITGSIHPKLSKRFFGPFQILERVEAVAYRLLLPPRSQIHPVFHCSLLRPHHGPPPTTTYEWSLQVHDNQPLRRPLCFLASWLDHSTNPPSRMVLTQWKGEPLEDTSWEAWSELCKTYHLEDKVVFGADGSVSISDDDCNISGDCSTDDRHTPNPRPARIKGAPTHLKDYYVNLHT